MSFAPFQIARSVVALAVLSALATMGCKPPAPVAGKPPPPEVIVAHPRTEVVGEFEDFTGRLEAFESVTIRSRVSGYLEKIHFVDGADVSAGALLFEIDRRTYAADVQRAQAALKQAEARRDRMELDHKRALELNQKKAISSQDVDRASGDLAEAVAAVASAKATVDSTKIQLDYTKIVSPLSGRIGKHLIDEGNLVKADDTALVTIVNLDSIYATFEVDERTVLKLRRLIQEGKLGGTSDDPAEVRIALSDEEEFSRSAPVSFVDNQVDRETGTLQLRATLNNEDRSLAPGLFVRVRVPLGQPKPSVLVPEEALGSDQGQRYVLLVDDKSDAVYRRVKVGQQIGRMRVIQEGLAGGEQVIVSGLQRVRRGGKVVPKFEGEETAAAKSNESPEKSDKKADAKSAG